MNSQPAAREALRVELLLALPDAGLRRVPAREPAGMPSSVMPGADLFDEFVPLEGFDAVKLTDFVLAQFDAVVQEATRDAIALADLESREVRAIEASAAAGSLSASTEFHRWLVEISKILRSGLDLAQQWDLARTVDVEAERLKNLMGQLLAEFPGLLDLPAAAPALVDQAGNPIGE